MNQASLAERLAHLSAPMRRALLGACDIDIEALRYHWRFWARPQQLPPQGDWSLWLLMAGRGFGKTRTGAEWVRALAEAHADARIALVGATLADARAVMVEGESGLLNICAQDQRPLYQRSDAMLLWPNGARAYLYSATAGGALRGPQHHWAWGDEVVKWPSAQDVLSNLRMGLRLGTRPQLLLTTTPRPLPWLKALMQSPTVVVSRGRTQDNAAHLPAAFIADMQASYGGTRLGRQELDGEWVEDVEGALWSRALIEAVRVAHAPATLVRVVIAVDPPAGSDKGTGDQCGIVVVARCAQGLAYVLADHSLQPLHPEHWARVVADAYQQHEADQIIAEANNGGQMVEAVLRAADRKLPITLVRASRGKIARAEPVAGLYHAGRVRHVGAFPALEDEMCALVSGAPYEGPRRSPDRADALVWGLTALMLQPRKAPMVRTL